MNRQWKDKILAISSTEMDNLALEIFEYQYTNNPVYRQYADAVGKTPSKVDSIYQIPFLPIRFFKSHAVQNGSFEPQVVFESSGTTGSATSRHYIMDALLYKEFFSKTFRLYYGEPSKWCIIGLLPSYLERKNSSLVFMVDELIQQSGHPSSGFYLNEYDRLREVLSELEQKAQPTLLIGVTFGLLDFAEVYVQGGQPLKHTTIIETGGMKGRRQEMVREEVHAVLKEAFKVKFIHSEYGMTELMSQAWSFGNGIFKTPPWMKIIMRDEEDPFHLHPEGTGAINIIDLGNIHSCSFIATDDIGRLYADGQFEVLGRLDNSDLRGCSLLAMHYASTP
jgi:phenylacetate-coenzyme A ligase PaaK-like adenylate-forming protein